MKDIEIYAWVNKICGEELPMHCNNRKILLLKKKPSSLLLKSALIDQITYDQTTDNYNKVPLYLTAD